MKLPAIHGDVGRRHERFVAATRGFGFLLTLVLQHPPDCHWAARKAYLARGELSRSKPGCKSGRVKKKFENHALRLGALEAHRSRSVNSALSSCRARGQLGFKFSALPPARRSQGPEVHKKTTVSIT